VLTLFKDFLRERRLTEIDAPMVREFCKRLGCAPVYYSYVLRIARKEHLIRKVADGTRSRWKVSPLLHERKTGQQIDVARRQKVLIGTNG
jgi:hypothetical protein